MSELSNGDILKALGLKLPSSQANPLRGLWDRLSDAFEDFSTFLNQVGNLSTWDEFENYLINEIGFTAEEAADLRLQLENKYDSFSDFDATINNYTSFKEWENNLSFGETTTGEATDEDGQAITGFRFFDSKGVTRDGVAVPAGSVEIFGTQVHFSESSPPTDEESSDSLFTWSNETYSPTTPESGEEVTISADVTNNGTTFLPMMAGLKVDGEVVKTSELIRIDSGATHTFTFNYSFTIPGDYDVRVGGAAVQTISVIVEGIV